jgi:Family of unknown function (DUF6516)
MTVLDDYLLKIRQTISGFAEIQVEQYREQLLTANRANLRIRASLSDKSLLEISEALVVNEGVLTWLSYRYHWQDNTGRLIFRYDDAPHHSEVETFPHHKHVAGTVLASQHPDLLSLLAEIQHLLANR